VSPLWQSTIAVAPALERWIKGGGEVSVGRLPRPAWPIVAGSLARASFEQGRSVLILVTAPERFADELRPWLNGRPSTSVFAEVTVSFLDRPPAFDESVNKRLEALSALARSAIEPSVVVASRRAITRQTRWSRREASFLCGAASLTCFLPRLMSLFAPSGRAM
jgi:hypothetical protein